MAIISVIQCDTTREKGEEEKHAMSVVTSYNKIRPGIYLEPAVIYQNIHLQPVISNQTIIGSFTVFNLSDI